MQILEKYCLPINPNEDEAQKLKTRLQSFIKDLQIKICKNKENRSFPRDVHENELNHLLKYRSMIKMLGMGNWKAAIKKEDTYKPNNEEDEEKELSKRLETIFIDLENGTQYFETENNVNEILEKLTKFIQ